MGIKLSNLIVFPFSFGWAKLIESDNRFASKVSVLSSIEFYLIRERTTTKLVFNGSFSSIEEIEGSFEYAPSAYECLAAKTFLQLSSTEKLDVPTRRVCSELGHSLLWHVDSLADSGFGYGVEVVEPEEHQPNLDAPGCKCGFPNIDFTDWYRSLIGRFSAPTGSLSVHL